MVAKHKVLIVRSIAGVMLLGLYGQCCAEGRLQRARIRQRRELLRKKYEGEEQWHNGVVAVASMGITALGMYMWFPAQPCPQQPLTNLFPMMPLRAPEPKGFFSNDFTNRVGGALTAIAASRACVWAFDKIDWSRVGAFMGGLVMRTSTTALKSLSHDREAASLYAAIEEASIEFVDGHTRRSCRDESHERASDMLEKNLEDLIAYGQARCHMTHDGFERLNAYEELAAALLLACEQAAQEPDLERIRVVRSMLATLHDMLGA